MELEIQDVGVLGRCPKPHKIVEGSTEVTVLGSARHKFICLDCGEHWEGGKIHIPVPSTDWP
jgi:hypothetical protein